MNIIDINSRRPRHKLIQVYLFRLTLLVAVGIGFYYMTKGV